MRRRHISIQHLPMRAHRLLHKYVYLRPPGAAQPLGREHILY
jgi:hypothetical protein